MLCSISPLPGQTLLFVLEKADNSRAATRQLSYHPAGSISPLLPLPAVLFLTETIQMAPKSVLVTGGNRGIGYGLVKKFLENKEIKHIFATARKPDEASVSELPF